jgi:hypothetical protein
MDAKVGIKIGEFDRGGKTRVVTTAFDHDFSDCPTLTPYGIFLPTEGELFLFFVQSKLTADCIVDRLEDWWVYVKNRLPTSAKSSLIKITDQKTILGELNLCTVSLSLPTSFN